MELYKELFLQRTASPSKEFTGGKPVYADDLLVFLV